MQAASRETLAAARERLDGYTDRAQPIAMEKLSEELFAAAGLLQREIALRRHLSDPSTDARARAALVDRLLSSRLGKPTLEVLRGLVGGRWSRPTDLVDGVEALARQAAFTLAQRDGSIEEVEDELFRFSRILDSQPRLRTMLTDQGAPVWRRVSLLESVLGERVRPVTARLLRELVTTPRGRSLERAVEELSELAAARRDRYIAHVRAAAPLTREQERRLADTLARIYQRQVALQVEIDPALLGGLTVRVGGEVIDGSVAGRLAQARQRLVAG
jgi:F-type H+-transporting ATPase subunit delta